MHVEGEDLHCEGGDDPAELDRLEGLGWDVVRWRGQNLFFGGVSAVERLEDGSLAAAGDPRRGGARGGGRMSARVRVRRAEPRDAAELKKLGDAVAAEPEAG